jgi:hypothetical protein
MVMEIFQIRQGITYCDAQIIDFTAWFEVDCVGEKKKGHLMQANAPRILRALKIRDSCSFQEKTRF